MRKLLILICLFISAQLSAQVYQIMPQYGYQTARMRMDSVLLVPADTIRNKSGVVRIGTQLYAGNGNFWTPAGGADSSVFFTKFRSDTMRANIYNAIANVPTPTLQQSYNVSSYPQIEFGNPFNTGKFSLYSSYIDNAKSGLFMDEGSKIFILGDSTKIASHLEINSGSSQSNLFSEGTTNITGQQGVNIIGKPYISDSTTFNKSIKIQTDSAQAGYVWTAQDATGQGEWRQSSAADSSVYFTNYRADTMRSNLYANKVPYTGATQDVDLGAHKLGVQAINVNGTNGNGNIHFKHQANDATATGQSTSLFANSNGDLKWKNDGEPYVTLQTNHISLDRTYRFPDSTGTIALLSNLTSKANLAGPTFTDSLVLTSTVGGISLPNMTQTQMNAITPRLGTQVYNTTYDAVCTYTNDFGWWSGDEAWVKNNGINVYTDFIAGATTGSPFGSTGNSAIIAGNATSTRPGIIRFQPTGTQRATISYSSSGGTSPAGVFYLGNGKIIYKTDIWIDTLSDATNTYWFSFGIGTGPGIVNLAGIQFLYTTAGTIAGSAASANWQCVTHTSSNVRTFTTTTTAVNAGQWTNLEMVINAAGTSVEFFINGTSVAVHTTNLPTGTSIQPYMNVNRTAGSATRFVDCDWIYFRQKFTTPR